MQMTEHETLAPLGCAHGTAVALGYFDGVHIGHRAVIGAAVSYAAVHGLESAVFTFVMPRAGEVKGKAILTPVEKQRRIASLGVTHYIRPPFSAFCNLTPQAFVRDVLKGAFGAKAVFCGENFTFGSHKSGNVDTLKALCAQEGIAVILADMAFHEGKPVSSSRIRAHLKAGEIEAVNAMLGEDYCIDLPVRHGKKIGGSLLGFPTINQIYPEEMLIPKSGVYITQAVIDGLAMPGATGLGTRPTVSGTGTTCETFLPGFTGDIYGETVRLRFCTYLKPTVKFNTLEELKVYICEAAQAAQQYFAR